jgi:hypothetical protein
VTAHVFQQWAQGAASKLQNLAASGDTINVGLSNAAGPITQASSGVQAAKLWTDWKTNVAAEITGTAWLLAETGTPVSALQTPAGEVAVRAEGADVYVAGRAEWVFELDLVELESPAEVRDAVPPGGPEATYVWAWIDEAAGTLRARCFVEEAGIAEDEATGAAAIVVGDRLGRPVTIHQGRGSVLVVRPLGDGRIEVGGGVRLDEVRDFPL